MRSRVGNAHASPTADTEALDEPVADRDRAEEGDLLRGDRRDQRLERVGLQAADGSRASRSHDGRQHRVGRGPARRTAARSNGAPSRCSTTGRVTSSSGSTSTPPGRAWMRTSRPADGANEHVTVEPVRQVGAERAEPPGRELEVVRIRKAQQRHRATCRTARRGRPAPRGSAASPVRANTRSAASDAQRSDQPSPTNTSGRSVRRANAVCSGRRRPGTGPRGGSGPATVGRGLGEVRAHLELDPLPLEHGHDQLRQPARDDQRAVARRPARGSPRAPRRSRPPSARPRRRCSAACRPPPPAPPRTRRTRARRSTGRRAH